MNFLPRFQILAIVTICFGGYVVNFLYEDAFLFDVEFITEAMLILVIGVAIFVIAVCGFLGFVTRFKPILIVVCICFLVDNKCTMSLEDKVTK